MHMPHPLLRLTPLISLVAFWAKRAVAVGCMAACLSSCASSAPAFGERGYTESGKASYYARKFQGRTMANGEKYRRGRLTAAHKTLPLGTKVKVTNTRNNRSVKLRITDRGPFVRGRIIDLSEKAARRLDFIKAGVVPVTLKVIQPAPAK
ncbi:septal ring lytic transglycosylase RlpA family protein [Pontibacter russatus]|uniref:septal ring lytic transglycosylase RlpA family protein n=1 Tax=Pontibacter russatus TaxID=2694929 RepID=UPI00293BD950|nr:septal ring lytic transglycosylase RlpA family protein [Pontibacter russatus]